MKIIRTIGYIFTILFGIFLFFYGGYDDSPGAQGLGLLIVAGGVWGLIRMKRKKSEVG